MTQTEERKVTSDAMVATLDMKFEIVVIPVSDIDRAKEFYTRLGWRLDADYDNGTDFRVIQFTPPGSGCSVIFGRNVTAAIPGSMRGLYLIVSTSKRRAKSSSRAGSRRARCSTMRAAYTPDRINPISSDGCGSAAEIPSIEATVLSYRSAIRTETAGCSRRLRRGWPGA